MNFTRNKSATYVLSAFVAGALLAACSSGGTQPASPSSGLGMNSSASHVAGHLNLRDLERMYIGVKWHGQMHRDHQKSWISPDVQNAPRLLFAADAAKGEVNIFRMSKDSMDLKEGTITGFQFPQGECGDSHGNIYVADSGGETVSAFRRTSTTPFATYDTSAFGFPVSCAWNNGNLAVTLYSSAGGDAGGVLIYTSASQTPIEVQNPGQENYYFAGYDPNGDLWVDGLDPSGAFILSFCGASSCSTIPTSGINFPGAVQWDRVRGDWVVFDQQCNGIQSSCSYTVAGSGGLGTPVDYLTYNGELACDLVQGVIGADEGNNFVVGGDNDTCGDAESNFARWAYPNGGKPTTHATERIVDPAGAAISNKNK